MKQFVAHRGYTARYPENTDVALSAAVKAGVRYVEIDVQLNAEREAILFHDRTLERLCGRIGAIHQLSTKETAELRVSDRHRFGYRYAQNPIMTLKHFCAWLSQRPQVTAFVEIKRISLQQFGQQAVIDAVMPLIQPLSKQVVVISYDLDVLANIRSDGVLPIGAVFDDWKDRKQLMIQKLKPEYLFCDWQTLPHWGTVSNPWGHLAIYECTDPDVAKRLFKQGVNLVETFAIGEMLQDKRLDEQPPWA